MPFGARNRTLAPGNITGEQVVRQHFELRYFLPLWILSHAVNLASMQDRGVDRIEAVIELVKKIALAQVTGERAFAVLAHKKIIAGKGRRLSRAQIGKHKP